MARRNVCHSCRHKWKVKKAKEWSTECPKCGRGNVGPTDPSSSILPKLLMVIAILIGGAYYAGLIGGDTSIVEDLKKQAEDAARELQGDDAKPARSRVPVKTKNKTKKKGKRRPKAKPNKPAKATPPPERAVVVVAGRSGAPVGSTYMVRGKIKNTGGVDAKSIVVVVTYKDASGKVLQTYDAECPKTLAAGKSARFESALAGDKAKLVETFEAAVTFD